MKGRTLALLALLAVSLELAACRQKGIPPHPPRRRRPRPVHQRRAWHQRRRTGRLGRCQAGAGSASTRHRPDPARADDLPRRGPRTGAGSGAVPGAPPPSCRPAVSCAVAPGTTTNPGCAPLSAIRTLPGRAGTTWGFVAPSRPDPGPPGERGACNGCSPGPFSTGIQRIGYRGQSDSDKSHGSAQLARLALAIPIGDGYRRA
jgi:predicted small lipoprotein YifL